MAYTTIDDPSAYFQTTLYTGNGSNNHGITNSGNSDLAPNWVWIKNKSTGANRVFDTVRGVNVVLTTDDTSGSDDNYSSMLTAFGSDGFTLANDSDGFNVNANNNSYVAWQWKAGTSFSNDASSTSVGTIDSTGSVSQTSGFSICTYPGNGTSGATIKHGLSTAPKIIIIKKKSAGDNWTMLNTNIDLNTHLHLNTTQAVVSDPMFTNTAPTTSVFTLDSDGQVNENNNTFVAYCFSEVKGYSKFGSYTGNGNADGTFVYTGFKPAWIMIKAIDQTGEGWFMFDNTRDVDNAVDKHLTANLNNAEGSGSHGMDFVSNGIKIRNGGDGTNTSDKNYIYMAFAEQPFVTSTGVPATAR